MKRIYASLNPADVHHAKNLLDAAGISTFVKNELLASAIGQLPFTDCQPELWLVDHTNAQRALTLLSEGPLHPSQKSDVWQCGCGEIQEAQFTQCWRCGTYRNAGGSA